jgi:hypothetical protein
MPEGKSRVKNFFFALFFNDLARFGLWGSVVAARAARRAFQAAHALRTRQQRPRTHAFQDARAQRATHTRYIHPYIKAVKASPTINITY